MYLGGNRRWVPQGACDRNRKSVSKQIAVAVLIKIRFAEIGFNKGICERLIRAVR